MMQGQPFQRSGTADAGELRAATGLVQGIVSRRHRPRDDAVRRLLAGADLAGLVVGLVAMILVANGGSDLERLGYGLLTLPVWIVLLKAYGLYDRDIKRISHTSVDDLPWLVHAMLVGCLMEWGVYKLVPGGGIEFGAVLVFGVVSVTLMIALRMLVRRYAKSILGPERVMLMGSGETAALLLRKMRAHPEYGLEPIGVISPAAEREGRALVEASPIAAATFAELPVLAHVGDDDLPSVLERHGVERLVISPAELGDRELLDMLQSCRALALKVSLLPQLFDALGPSVEVDDVEGVTVLGINPPVLSPSSMLLKRIMDLAGSLVLLIFAAPVCVVAAIAIKLDSHGPVLFRQERVGRGGRRFKVVKFRTMVIDAEDMREGLLAESIDQNWLHLVHDPRVTRVGRILRRSSLDELPQLFNVLRGEMSLVGPRPLIQSEFDQLKGWARSRIDLTPGLTGLWQVLGRTNIPFEEMIKLDYLYVTNWSLWNDLRLILRTLPVVVTRRGAN
jgi:exopolysaccharide biosynthesis polyprenyl glycosylphosphotransferase